MALLWWPLLTSCVEVVVRLSDFSCDLRFDVQHTSDGILLYTNLVTVENCFGTKYVCMYSLIGWS